MPVIEQVVSTGMFIGGNEVSSFEQEFADFCNTKYAAGVASGTAALYLALRALGIGQGDEVITVSHTFFATVGAIMMTGAKPVLVDVYPTWISARLNRLSPVPQKQYYRFTSTGSQQIWTPF